MADFRLRTTAALEGYLLCFDSVYVKFVLTEFFLIFLLFLFVENPITGYYATIDGTFIDFGHLPSRLGSIVPLNLRWITENAHWQRR